MSLILQQKKYTAMDKKDIKDAYDIGENMAILNEEGKSFTIINKETGKARQFVNESWDLLIEDTEIDFDAINKGCPNFYNTPPILDTHIWSNK